MLAFSTRTQLTIGIVLALLMGVTRGYHFTPLEQLPSASWAVFFLAGVSDFCVNPAYGFLLPAYGTLWLAGHWYASRHRDAVTTLIPLTLSVLIGAGVCEVISSGSFYFLSGRFGQTTVTQFAHNFTQYFPYSLSSLAFYVFIAGMIHAITRVPMMSFSRGRATS